jgi:myo-inositol-1-phosphate synthase
MEYFGESASSMIVNIERDKTPDKKRSKKNFGTSILYRAETKKVTVYNAFDFSKPTFRNKVSKAFGIELKEALKKENSKEQMSQLQDKFGG